MLLPSPLTVMLMLMGEEVREAASRATFLGRVAVATFLGRAGGSSSSAASSAGSTYFFASSSARSSCPNFSSGACMSLSRRLSWRSLCSRRSFTRYTTVPQTMTIHRLDATVAKNSLPVMRTLLETCAVWVVHCTRAPSGQVSAAGKSFGQSGAKCARWRIEYSSRACRAYLNSAHMRFVSSARRSAKPPFPKYACAGRNGALRFPIVGGSADCSSLVSPSDLHTCRPIRHLQGSADPVGCGRRAWRRASSRSRARCFRRRTSVRLCSVWSDRGR